MDKLSHLSVRRLRHLAARETRRHALANGLLELKIAEVRGNLVRRYTPAYDTSPLTFDPSVDLAWLARTFGSTLHAPPRPQTGEAGTQAGHQSLGAAGRLTGLVSRLAVNRSASPLGAVPGHAFDRRVYAVGLVGLAAPPVNIVHIAASLLLARAVSSCGMTLAQVIDIVRRPAPIITMLSPVDGGEDALLKLIEMTGLIPGGPYAGATGDNFYDHDTEVPPDIETRRRLVHFLGKGIHRDTRTMKLRLETALGSDYPIVAIAKQLNDIPDQIRAAADLHLDTDTVDLALVTDLLQAVYSDIDPGDRRLQGFDPKLLTLNDLVLALRPGRPLDQALIVLGQLAARNAEDGEDDGAQKSTASPTARQSAVGETKNADNSSAWKKKEKPSGAEIIKPEPLPDESSGHAKPPVTVETLSGYGAAQRWALDLKLDLGDYCTGDLEWSQMSTKLLLSGPPGTGKTSFARALCNTLQTPLVVTSVSTWLQGGHLNDVIDKMSRTFAEARSQAPSILFIDEIDGIGKRVDPDREYSEYWNTIVNKLLELLDGAVKSEGVIVIGATNRPEHIDGAIKRSGRLETHIEIPKPDILALAGIIAHHLGKDIDVLMEGAAPSERQRLDKVVGEAFAAETFVGAVEAVQGGQL
ncbi:MULTISPECIES: ATP-binding protein [unclassified Rhizobium]|uniref:ATP-binding protein n=1 Tax=unclassified Rhizobium TaxID=2613769 RepID=UPI001AE9647A|nr:MULTISPECIES: ATP-binding protein [unclassified Rhizobium]MBP2460179.1 hypothetical protein [Rhizobium sp. PvP014]MBP2531538.1 hypothetical protein [Rhizobium sp. PvP099]